MPKLFPKLLCVSSLGIRASHSWERCVQEETGAKKSNSLEARTPHQCDDRFLCLFSIWEFQNTSQSHLRGATGAVFLVSDTWISQPQPPLVLPFGRQRCGAVQMSAGIPAPSIGKHGLQFHPAEVLKEC